MPKTIKLLEDRFVAADGFTVEKWLKGEVRENVPDAVADDLTHPLTLSAIEVTGNDKADAKAEDAALAAAAQKAADIAEAATLQAASEQAALKAVKAPPKL
jgi:hypothetical protein